MDTPERRERQRASYERMRQDPVKVEHYRERKREWARRVVARRKKTRETSRPGEVDTSTRDRLRLQHHIHA